MKYCKFFKNENDAECFCEMKNVTAKSDNIFAVVDGPEDNFAVVDIHTAIDLGSHYLIL
jgi:hypothetical protein